MLSVTVTSAATDPDCIGAVPLLFSSESASSKLRPLRAAVGSNRSRRTVYLSVTRSNRPGNCRRVIQMS